MNEEQRNEPVPQPMPTDAWEEPQDAWKADEPRAEVPFQTMPYTPDSPEETIRKSGMAYSAGIAFFASVVFCLGIGWIADWLLGSRPWGLVAGIVLGSIIGFMQFFRISSRIFKKQSDGPRVSPLLNRHDDFDQ